VEVEGGRPAGPRQSDQEILARIVLAVKDLYRKEGGAFPDPVLNLTWSLHETREPDLGEVLPGDQRESSRRPPRPEGQDEGHQDGRTGRSNELSAASGRRAPRAAETGSTPAPSRRPATTRSAGAPRTRPVSGCSPPVARFSWPAGTGATASIATAPRPTPRGTPWTRPGPASSRNGEKVRSATCPDIKARLEAGRVRRVHS